MARADKKSITEYLLGRLTEAEEEQIELRLLTDPEFAEEYDIVVNEIVDDYVSGKFLGEELKQVEEHFFKSTERRSKLKFAQALHQHRNVVRGTSPNPGFVLRPFWKRSPFIFRLAAAATLLAVITGGLWFVLRRQQPDADIATVTLFAGAGSRGDEAELAKPVKLDADSLRIVLQLPATSTPPPAANYRIEVFSIGGRKTTVRPVSQDASSVTLIITRGGLSPGDYALKLVAIGSDGSEHAVGTYFLTVE